MLRATYCFARYIDDILDEDEKIDESPQHFIVDALNRIENGLEKKGRIIDRLGRYVFDNISNYSNEFIDPSEELQQLIEVMLFDRRRARSHRLLTAEELNAHHERTFCSALNVTLCITGAEFTREHVQTIARTQGCLYTLRDLREDLRRGVVNIPKGVINEARMQGAAPLEYASLRETAAFRQWLSDELERGRQCVNQMSNVLRQNHDFNFRVTVFPLYLGLRKLPHRLQKKYSVPEPEPSIGANE